MKKIIAVSMVKNESDIIESFCRHTLTFCDEMLICDDRSTDNTREIIENMQKEGLNIHLHSNVIDHGYYQMNLTNSLISHAVSSYGADIVLPLDADEFLLPKPNCDVNTREILESLDSTRTYSAEWVHFIPTVFNRDNSVFLPKYFGQYCGYANGLPKNYHLNDKAIISSTFFKECGAYVNQGNHHFFTKEGISIEKTNLPMLMLAHLPLRSVEQLITKSVIGWSNSMCMPDHKTNPINSPYHWNFLYEIIKTNGWLSDARVQAATIILYGQKMSHADTDDVEIELINYAWNSGIKLKYTDYKKSQKSYLSFILAHYENIINYFMNELSLRNTPTDLNEE